MPLPHFIWLPSSAGNLPPRCKENAAGTEENSVLALPNNPPPSPATAGHCSCLLCPAGVSRSQTAPFSSQPAQEPRCRLIGSARRESRPGLGVPRSGSRRAAAAEKATGAALQSPAPQPPGAGRVAGVATANPTLAPRQRQTPRHTPTSTCHHLPPQQERRKETDAFKTRGREC
ncbi:uncharacterized protein LOC144245754 isoform X2 [Crocuta crocuta]